METANKILERCKFHLGRWFGRSSSDQKQSGAAAAEADPAASAPAEEMKLQIQHQAKNPQVITTVVAEETVVEVTERGGAKVSRGKGDGRGDWH